MVAERKVVVTIVVEAPVKLDQDPRQAANEVKSTVNNCVWSRYLGWVRSYDWRAEEVKNAVRS